MKYFTSSFIISFICIILAYFIGGIEAAFICILLAILEVSLSFDNAVVNAKVLDKMSKIWQRRFIVFGIPIAVFGMRFIFPVLIVSIATNLGIFHTINLAINDPISYKNALELGKEGIYAFGGSFLFMVFLDFFFDKKDHHWFGKIENSSITQKLSSYKYTSISIGILTGILLFLLTNSTQILYAYILAIFLHVLISSLDKLFNAKNIQNGFMSFLYLEVLDASFSFDGVIGAFAMSSNIFIIMIGLGIGALFVRSLTIYLVEKKTLKRFIYLEHGAHYAILMLALIMFLELFFHISEVITGTIGIAFIIASLISSLKYNKANLAN